MMYIILEMSESDILASDHIDCLDGLENGQDGDAIMQCDGVKRELNEPNADDPVSKCHSFNIFSYKIMMKLVYKKKYLF